MSKMPNAKCCIVFCLLVVAVVGWVMYFWIQVLIPMGPLVRRDFLWPVSSEVYAVSSSGPTIVYTLVQKNGHPVQAEIVPFHSANGRFVYWSEPDRELAVLGDGAVIRWLAPPRGLIHDNWKVESVRVDGKGYALINICEECSPTAVAIVDLGVNRWELIGRMVEAFPCDTSKDSIIVGLDRSEMVLMLDICDLLNTNNVLPRSRLGRVKGCTSWDADCSSGTLFQLLNSRRLLFADPCNRKEVVVKIPARYSVRNVRWNSLLEELWVSYDAPFTTYGFLIYSRSGKLVGVVEHCIGPSWNGYVQPLEKDISTLLWKSNLPRSVAKFNYVR
jgi:hypothetical protein